MSRINHKIFLAGVLSFVFFFSFSQSSQAGFFDWFKLFRKSTPQNTTEIIPNVKKNMSSASSKSSSTSSKTSSTKSSSSSSFSVKSTKDWKTYRNEEYGFEFKYPVGWNATLNLNYTEGTNYKVIARVVNPARAGKTDTDVPIEMFLVRSLNYPCKGQTTNLTGRAGTDTGWDKGFGDIYYRTLCFKTDSWPITVSLSAYDYPSQIIMERILSTFKFIESPKQQLHASSMSSSFASKTTIIITSPTGGEQWEEGSSYLIKWDIPEEFKNEQAQLLFTNPECYDVGQVKEGERGCGAYKIGSVMVKQGYYNWNIPRGIKEKVYGFTYPVEEVLNAWRGILIMDFSGKRIISKQFTIVNDWKTYSSSSKDERTESPKFKKCQSGKDDCVVLVVVDSKTSNAISGELGQFKNDLVNDGYKPVMIESGFSTPEEVKKEMQKYKDSVEGAILIGNIPFARMADPAIVANSRIYESSFISDNYYADIQGFCDKKTSFYYDIRVCQKPTLLYPYIWVGRIMASKAGSDGVKQLKDYFRRNHEYRIGQEIDPTRILYVVQDNLLLGVSEIEFKNEFTRKDISVSKWKSSDITTLVSTKDNKKEFLNKLQEDYPIAIVNVHGSNRIISYNVTNQDIENIKPQAKFIDLQSCSTADAETRNGTFVQNYLAGEYLFSGSALIVKASPVVHFEFVPSQQQPFIKAVAFGNSFGEAMRIDWQGAYILLGDPTLNFASKRVDAELEVSQKEVDLGTIVFEKDYSFKEGRSATDEKITNLTFKNIGNEIIEFQPTINYVAQGLSSNVTKKIKPKEEVTISYKSYGHQKILNEASYVPQNGQQYIEPLYILTDSKTKPIIQIDFKYTAKVI